MALKETAGKIFRDQRFRFLLVGGFNTAFGFLVFIVLDMTLGRAMDDGGHEILASIVTLLVSHVIASIVAFVLYRRFVFKVKGNVPVDFIRFQGVYAVPLAINVVVLPLLVAVGVPRILAQGSIIVVTTIFSYVGHRFFSFRRSPGSGEGRDPLAEVFVHDGTKPATAPITTPKEDAS